ncbi:MAG TPA: hypothetical protein VMS77_06720 [Conexivisphaerales archaeon]|nr:hypothetical protein [Conexivisphaerales archaeon]
MPLPVWFRVIAVILVTLSWLFPAQLGELVWIGVLTGAVGLMLAFVGERAASGRL